MKILSLFDGISCGRVALERAGIPVDRYVAYEIEPTAVKIALKNYESTEEMGNVFAADFKDYRGFDLLIGGSPCTYWSIAQKADRRETENSGLGWDLFSQYIRALKEGEIPYFLYENNFSMDNAIKAEITKAFNAVMDERRKNFPEHTVQHQAACNYQKIEAIHINSGLVSAQSRDRYYWTNIPGLCQPKDMGITLQSILEFGYADRNKALCIARRYAGFQGTESYQCRRYFGKSFGQAVFKDKESRDEVFNLWKADPYFDKGKEVQKDQTERRIRQLTPLECERLQTLPDGYTDGAGVSNQMRIEAIGNGWTVNVIAHLLKGFDRAKQPKKFDFGV